MLSTYWNEKLSCEVFQPATSTSLGVRLSAAHQHLASALHGEQVMHSLTMSGPYSLDKVSFGTLNRLTRSGWTPSLPARCPLRL